MTKRVLVTGATGFIGRHTLLPLLARGYDVHAVTSLPISQPSTSNGVQWHQVNLLNPQQVSELIAQIEPSSLLHLAWYAVPGLYWTSLENIEWVQASLHLVSEFGKAGGSRIVMAGTCAEYDWRYGYCTEELTPLKPNTLYGVCKHSLAMMLEALARQMQVSIAWGRIFWLYGPHEHSQRLVPAIVRPLLQAQPALCTPGTQIRDFMHVEDVASALVAVLDSEFSGPINIASGVPVTVREIALAIGQMIGSPDLVHLGARPMPAGEPPLVVANTSRLTNEVGWHPDYDLASGLTQTVAWWRTQAAA